MRRGERGRRRQGPPEAQPLASAPPGVAISGTKLGRNALTPYSIVIIGVGKIALDQHLPVSPRIRVSCSPASSATAARGWKAVPTFATPAEAYAALPDLDAVAICMPPNIRYAFAPEALEAGKHVMLEKPTAQTVARDARSRGHADERGRVIFSTWHSQYNAAVDMAKDAARGREAAAPRIEWKEDVRRWHPGQEWIGTPAISASSIPASTRCRSSPRSRPARSSSNPRPFPIPPTATRRSPLRLPSRAPPASDRTPI